MSPSHCRAFLDRRHAVNLHISHRLVLSANSVVNEVLLVEYRRVCVRIHGAHRLQSRLQNWTPLAVISNFSKKFLQKWLFCGQKKSFWSTYLRMYSAQATNNTISSTQATARTSAGSRRIREQWMNDSSSPEGQWTLPSHQMDALTQALSSVHECWQSSANLNKRVMDPQSWKEDWLTNSLRDGRHPRKLQPRHGVLVEVVHVGKELDRQRRRCLVTLKRWLVIPSGAEHFYRMPVAVVGREWASSDRDACRIIHCGNQFSDP